MDNQTKDAIVTLTTAGETLVSTGERPVDEAAYVPRPTNIVAMEQLASWRKQLTTQPNLWVSVFTDVVGRDTPANCVCVREGPSHLMLKYVNGAYAIATRAMLACLGIASDLEVLQTDVGAEAVECLVKLTFKYQGDTISSTQWGECYRRAGMALGDVKKGAVTDGLKKCLSEYGWAWDVYNADPIVHVPPSPEEVKKQSLDTFYSVASGKGMTRDEVDKFVFNKLGKAVAELDSKDLTSVKRKIQRGEIT